MPKYSLMAHQTAGVKFLDDMDGIGALLFDPGVGKTGTTLSWVDSRVRKTGEFRVLVVAPLTAADTWVLQAPPFMDAAVKARMLEGRTADLLSKIKAAHDWRRVPDMPVMVNHPGDVSRNRGKVTILSMSSGAVSSWCQTRVRTVQMLQAIRKYSPHLIVVDESHLIKAHNSNVSKAMYSIGQCAPHRIILTGTVNPHSPLDCYGQWRFLAPWTFSNQYNEAFTKNPLKMTRSQAASIRPWAWGTFKDRYAESIPVRGKGGKTKMLAPGVPLTTITGVNHITIDELHERVAERSMVVRKEDALNLPPVTDVDVHVHLSRAESKMYDQMRDELAAELDSGELLEAPNALAKIMKLRQITAGFVKDTETGLTHEVGDAKRKAVTEVVDVTLAGEQRVVVFAYFKSECAALAQALAGPGQTVEVITGATPAKERLAIRQRFADVTGVPGRVILVAQARTMSLSVNELVVAQHAVYASMSERRDDWVQSRGRLDRNGQTLPVTFWNCFVPDTVDEVMIENHKHRGSLEKALLDHIRSTKR